jgi:accessory gene regulator B
VNINFIDKSALYLTRSIRKHNPDAASEKALFYSLCLLINTSTAITLVLITGLVTGHFSEAVISVWGYLFLRYFSGGAHMDSSLSCCITSAAILILVSHLSFDFLYIGVIFNFVSMIILIITVPDGIQNVSRINPRFYPYLKIICLIIVSSNFIFQSPVLSAAFFAQAFLTTQLGHRFLVILERRRIY